MGDGGCLEEGSAYKAEHLHEQENAQEREFCAHEEPSDSITVGVFTRLVDGLSLFISGNLLGCCVSLNQIVTHRPAVDPFE
jgi:hypothetical protein